METTASTTTTEVTEDQQKHHHQGVSFLRHAGWVGPNDFTEPLTIVGCGAVGSHIAMLAARMGFHRFILWDADVVESHNLANQVYDHHHVGVPKVEALKEVLTRFNPQIKVATQNQFFISEKHSQNVIGPIAIATDSMASRKDIYDTFFMNPDVTGVIEVRLGFDYGEVHVIDNMDPIECEAWKSTLVDDDEVDEGPCNLRICTTLVQLTSSVAVHNLCSRYAALRQDKPWVYKTRTMFSLGSQQLRVMAQN